MRKFKDNWRADGLTATELSAAAGVNIQTVQVQMPKLKKNKNLRYTPGKIKTIAVHRTKLKWPMKDDERKRWNDLLKYLGLGKLPDDKRRRS